MTGEQWFKAADGSQRQGADVKQHGDKIVRLKTPPRLKFAVNRGLRQTVQQIEDGQSQVIEVKSA